MKITLFTVAMASAFLAVSTTAFSATRSMALPMLARGAFGATAASNSPRCSSNQSQTQCRMSAASDFAAEQIASNDVVVFSKSFCPFCKKTKKTLDKMEIAYTALELNEMDDGADIQDALLEMTGQRTVPNVFIKGKHLGGNDDTQKAAKSGDLKAMLE